MSETIKEKSRLIVIKNFYGEKIDFSIEELKNDILRILSEKKVKKKR